MDEFRPKLWVYINTDLLDAQAGAELALCSSPLSELAMGKKQINQVFIFILPQLEGKFLPNLLLDTQGVLPLDYETMHYAKKTNIFFNFQGEPLIETFFLVRVTQLAY